MAEKVLTLLILENGLWEKLFDYTNPEDSLNPSYTGKRSLGDGGRATFATIVAKGLNPSYTGKRSLGLSIEAIPMRTGWS